MPRSHALRAGHSLQFTLNPSTPVLLRPDGAVQVGWDPRRAVLVHPPSGLNAAGLAELLRTMQSGATLAQLNSRFGVDTSELVASLVDSGVVTTVARRRTRSASIRIHGRGPLSDVLASALRCSGARVTQSSLTKAAPPQTTDLVVLSDFLVADPRVVRELHIARVPHLMVRMRDGAGLVGPLVIPGVTSCLDCADLHRSDRDAAWPAVAAQLRDTVGSADRATVLATAALALNQVDRVIRAVRAGDDVGRSPAPPPTLNTTLEFDVNTGSIMARRWARHPRCQCTRRRHG
ncbi:MAG TPA: cyclodehydratase [Mycobacterium sp.]|nr:cyclodehydratase [Mycobacterium sp.]